MRWPRYLQRLCGEVGVWTCRVEEEGLGDVARSFWIEGLSLCQRLDVESRCVSVLPEMLMPSSTKGCR